MHQRHVVIFARTPRYGRVKTRLAREIGTLKTLRFYRNTLERLIRRLRAIPDISLSVALTPDGDVWQTTDPMFKGVPLLEQGQGDLGRRMPSVLRRLPPGPAVIIGSDIPDIESKHINRAFDALDENDAVFGPSGDGGYWLVGVKQLKALPPNFMRAVRWSSVHTLADTTKSLPNSWKVAYIDKLDDVDVGSAFWAWQARQR